MKERIIRYFASGNTGRGFYSLFDDVLKDLDRIFILKGGPGTGKSSLMKEIGSRWLKAGYDLEYIHCSLESESIDGVIIPSLKVAVVDGTRPHIIEPKIPGVVEEYVNLGTAWDSQALIKEKEAIFQLNDQIGGFFQKAYASFAEALTIHDEWEKIYINNMNFAKAERLTEKLTESFFGTITLNKQAKEKHRFLGAATPTGPVDFIPNLTGDLKKRYFIKGRPGSGKSTMLKKLAEEGKKRGFDVEVYHCGFDPNSIDMVIFRELSIAIFDSTLPHEYFPSRQGDEIIDLYGTVIDEMTDDLFAEQIAAVSKQYKEKMKEGTENLAKAKALRDQLESIYIKTVDFSIVDQLREEIDGQIKDIAKSIH